LACDFAFHYMHFRSSFTSAFGLFARFHLHTFSVFVSFQAFNFHIGNVNVDYSATSVVVNVPGDGKTMDYTITGLTPGSTYKLTSKGCGQPAPATAKADAAHGAIAFQAPTGIGCAVSATKQ
jgi:hypothetical protein